MSSLRFSNGKTAILFSGTPDAGAMGIFRGVKKKKAIGARTNRKNPAIRISLGQRNDLTGRTVSREVCIRRPHALRIWRYSGASAFVSYSSGIRILFIREMHPSCTRYAVSTPGRRTDKHEIRIHVDQETPCAFTFSIALAPRSHSVHPLVSPSCSCNFSESTFLLTGFS